MYFSKTPKPFVTFIQGCFWIGVLMTLVGVLILTNIPATPLSQTDIYSLNVWGYKLEFTGAMYIFWTPFVQYKSSRYFQKYHFVGMIMGLIFLWHSGPDLESVQMLNEGTFWLLLVPPALMWMKMKFTKNGDRLTNALRGR